jgi:hypothetical protein
MEKIVSVVPLTRQRKEQVAALDLSRVRADTLHARAFGAA